MIVGYASVTGNGPDLAHQMQALRDAGAERVYAETVAAAAGERPELTALLAELGPGDRLIILSLDCLGGSNLNRLVPLLDRIGQTGAALTSLSDKADTRTSEGLLRALTRLRAAATGDASRPVGRPRVMTPQAVRRAQQLYDEGRSLQEVADLLHVSRSTVQRHVAAGRRPREHRAQGQLDLQAAS